MRLFFALCRKKSVNGHIFRGKNRLVTQVTPEHIAVLRNRLRIEEQNMFYLRHPYLTPEESAGHSLALGKQEARRLKLVTTTKEFKGHVTLESRLAHLRYSEAWD